MFRPGDHYLLSLRQSRLRFPRPGDRYRFGWVCGCHATITPARRPSKPTLGAGTGFPLVRATLLLTSSPVDEPVYWAISEDPLIDRYAHPCRPPRGMTMPWPTEPSNRRFRTRRSVFGHGLDCLSEGLDLGPTDIRRPIGRQSSPSPAVASKHCTRRKDRGRWPP